MNPLNRLSNKNARIAALYLHWTQKQGSALAWPKADNVARAIMALVLAFFVCLYAIPESEATVWIKTTAMYYALTGIGGCILAATALLLAVSVGRSLAEGNASYKARQAELAAIPEGETRQAIEAGDPEDWTYTGKMSPLLSPMDKLRISQSTNPKLNEQTAATVKACLAAGLTTAETSRETGLSLDTVKKYAALIRKGFDSPALSVEL